MAKYNYIKKTILDKEVLFVTRGRSKPFTEEEIADFVAEHTLWDISKEKEGTFEIPNVKMFSVDLRAGLAFCAAKYGTTTDAVKEKAAEIFPHLSLEQLTK